MWASVVVLALGMGSKARAEGLDLSKARVLIADDAGKVEAKAVEMLIDEVHKRSRLHWPKLSQWPQDAARPLIVVGQEAGLRAKFPRVTQWLDANKPVQGAEGYRVGVDVKANLIVVAGNDARGVLFGVGRLLRELRLGRDRAEIAKEFQVATAPRFPLRGHQLGYRPKTNSYDGWDFPQWEQYIRDLAVFGTNAIELLPPKTDDDPDSPHFPRPQLEMMVGMSRLADEYGLDVWVWYPTEDDLDYGDPKILATALREWGEIFEALPRIDAVFVPGGDPGNSAPGPLMKLLEKQAESLRNRHPKAQMWVSPQGFGQDRVDEFLKILRDEPKWLTGIVHGPQVRLSAKELRESVPARYPIRLYPDITHNFDCQYPVPDWDIAFGLTEGREPINPRPLGQATIFHADQNQAIGFITYSEGCNDDVNKFVWSGLGWDPDAAVVDLVRQYSRYFIGDAHAEGFAQGLFALERNWQGPLLANSGVETTLRQFQDLERSVEPRVLLNWRFQQALYRAYYDAHIRDRLIHETALENQAYDALRRSGTIGSLAAMAEAQAALAKAVTHPVSADRRARVHELAEALYQSVRMQLSVVRYKATAVRRGANLDAIDAPLNNRNWLLSQFAAIGKLGREQDRQKGIAELLGHEDPGPGGFYDAPGDPSRRPHLVLGDGFVKDPDFRRSPRITFGNRPDWPLAWCRYAQSLYDAPLEMHYDRLDPHARYRLRVIHPADSFPTPIRLTLQADGRQIHGPMAKPDPVRALEFDIPADLTADGSLTLRWLQEPGRGGSGRGNQVAEVWLIRVAP